MLNLNYDYLGHAMKRIRVLVARACMWLIKPILGPMLHELDTLLTQVIQRKVDKSEIREDAQGVLHSGGGNKFNSL